MAPQKKSAHIRHSSCQLPTSTHSSLGQVQAYEAWVEGMISFVFSLKHNLISKTHSESMQDILLQLDFSEYSQ